MRVQMRLWMQTSAAANQRPNGMINYRKICSLIIHITSFCGVGERVPQTVTRTHPQLHLQLTAHAIDSFKLWWVVAWRA